MRKGLISKPKGTKEGISRAILEQAFAGVVPNPRVIELDRKQPEFTLTFEQYLDRVVPEFQNQKRSCAPEGEREIAWRGCKEVRRATALYRCSVGCRD